MQQLQSAKPQPLRFYLRKLDEPFKCECSSLYDEQMKQDHIKWATARTGIKNGSKAYEHTVACDISYWMALSFPLTDNLHKYKNAFYFFQMFATMDDHADESWGDGAAGTGNTKKFWNKAIALIETLRDEAPWYIKKLRNLMMLMPGIPSYMKENFKRLKNIMNELSAVQRNRFINSFKEYMENAVLHAQMKGKEKQLTLEQYKVYKLKSSGAIPSTLMIEYLYEIALTDKEYHHPILKQLEKAANLQACFVNELFSLFKEYSGSLENLNHAVSILVLNGRKTVQQAIDVICSEIELLQDEFINIRDKWYAGNELISKNVRKYIAGLEYYMAGATRWHRLSKRYHGADFDTVITSGMMEWSPGGTIYTPDNVIKFTETRVEQAVTI